MSTDSRDVFKVQDVFVDFLHLTIFDLCFSVRIKGINLLVLFFGLCLFVVSEMFVLNYMIA